MIADEVQNNITSIEEACKKYCVKTLHLFGSATMPNYTKESDLDFLVEYYKTLDGRALDGFDYFDFLFSLQKITGKKVDLVVKEAVRNSYFKKSLEKQKVLIYG